MTINSRQEQLKDTFEGRKTYQIPSYQRPYVWEYDQALKLISDLMSAWEAGEDDYFLGSLVLVRSQGSDQAEVVDGQQRLTTVAIILSVIRWLARDGWGDSLNDRLKTKGDAIQGLSASPRVKLRPEDSEFFESYIVEGDLLGLREPSARSFATQGQRNMRRSADAVYESIIDLEPERLLELTKYILDTTVIVVETDRFDYAHRIFGVLNTRGVPLAAADVFKSRILSKVDEPRRDYYALLWEEALNRVSAEPDSFFHQVLVSITKEVPKQALSIEFDARVIERMTTESHARDFIDHTLVPLSHAYQAVEKSADDGVTDALDLLSDYQSSEWRAPAMWVLSNVTAPQERNRLLMGVDRVLGVHTLAGSAASIRSSAMLRLLKAFERSKSVGADVPDRVFHIEDETIHSAIAALMGPLPRSSRRVVALKRAHWQELGPAGLMSPTVSWAGLVAPAPVASAGPAFDEEALESRLGTLALTKTDNARVKRATGWAELCSLVNPSDTRQRSVATWLDPETPLSNQLLKQRHRELVDLVIDFWNLSVDSEGMAMKGLSELEVLELSGTGRIARSRSTKLADVVRAGLLLEGDVLIWERPVRGERIRATVTASGALRMRDGRIATSPSGAAKLASASSGDALSGFKRESDNVSLRELWERYEARFVAPDGKTRSKTKSSHAAKTQTRAQVRTQAQSRTRAQAQAVEARTSGAAKSPQTAGPSRDAEPARIVDALPRPSDSQRVNQMPVSPRIQAKPTLPRQQQAEQKRTASVQPSWMGRQAGAKPAAPPRPARVSPEEKPTTRRLAAPRPAPSNSPHPDEVTWTAKVTSKHTTTAWSPLPIPVRKELRLMPGETREYDAGRAVVTVSWSEDGGPRLGDIRTPLIVAGLLQGDTMEVSISGSELSIKEVSQDDDTVRTPPQQRGESPLRRIKDDLRAVGIECDDKRPVGGALWIPWVEAAEPFVEAANRHGADFKLRTRGTGERAWWTKKS